MFMMTSAAAISPSEMSATFISGPATRRTRSTKPSSPAREFFNGFCWSDDLKELKYLLRRDKQETGLHLLESDEYRDAFHKGSLDRIAAACAFRVKVK